MITNYLVLGLLILIEIYIVIYVLHLATLPKILKFFKMEPNRYNINLVYYWKKCIELLLLFIVVIKTSNLYLTGTISQIEIDTITIIISIVVLILWSFKNVIWVKDLLRYSLK